jgi:hypothetical protein
MSLSIDPSKHRWRLRLGASVASGAVCGLLVVPAVGAFSGQDEGSGYGGDAERIQVTEGSTGSKMVARGYLANSEVRVVVGAVQLSGFADDSGVVEFALPASPTQLLKIEGPGSAGRPRVLEHDPTQVDDVPRDAGVSAWAVGLGAIMPFLFGRSRPAQRVQG